MYSFSAKDYPGELPQCAKITITIWEKLKFDYPIELINDNTAVDTFVYSHGVKKAW